MTTTFKAACVQPNGADNVQDNLAQIIPMIRQARYAGADFIATPEVSNVIANRKAQTLAQAETEADSVSLTTYRDLAAETGAWLLIGSLCIRLDDDERIANRSYLIDGAGDVVARYDKIHMFDVDLANGERYRESSTFRPGNQAVVAETPWGRLGMTICYDIRFAALYRNLAQAGAEILSIPAAFTRPTGRAHWHVLQRSRAIENGCYVIAPAQCGVHGDKRETYGHSLIIGPWGDVLADGGDDPGIIAADIDMAEVAKARGMVASLRHDRDFVRLAAAPDQAAAAE